jgi:hypothetical protein
MVDFNNEATISTPAVDIIRVLILQRRNDALDAIEYYNKKVKAGIDYGTDVMGARIFSYFLEIECCLKRQLENKSFEDLEKEVKSDKYNDLLTAFRTMNTVLDKIKLTKIDTGKDIDTSNVEEENKERGL